MLVTIVKNFGILGCVQQIIEREIAIPLPLIIITVVFFFYHYQCKSVKICIYQPFTQYGGIWVLQPISIYIIGGVKKHQREEALGLGTLTI
jgi:S-adenosylmethionine synthetase